MSLILVISQFLGGCLLLAFGAERFITASAVIARRAGLPTIVIGMLLVGFGTSFPEIVVSILASLHGTPTMAIGNSIGSNIMNCGLVIGVAALILPLAVDSSLLKREFPIMIGISIFVWVLFFNGYLGRIDGIILLVGLAAYLYWMIAIVPKREAKKDLFVEEVEKELPKDGMSKAVSIIWWIVGLILLFISSELIVSGATTIAKWLHISNLVIGLTIVAIGTSLPELAASVVSAIKKEPEIAIGNVVGSNIFNLLAVLAAPALIAPTKLPSTLIWRDYPIMLAFCLALWLLSFFPRKSPTISRLAGSILLLGFAAFIASIIIMART